MRLYLEHEQKRRLVERARLHGNTISEEIGCALDFYIALGICSEDELGQLARRAKSSAERIIIKLDETTTYVERTLAKVNRRARPSCAFRRC